MIFHILLLFVIGSLLAIGLQIMDTSPSALVSFVSAKERMSCVFSPLLTFRTSLCLWSLQSSSCESKCLFPSVNYAQYLLDFQILIWLL